MRSRLATVVLALLALLTLGACAPPIPPASAAQRAQVRVVLYTTRWCPVCTHARGWLQARGIPYQDRDVEASPNAAAVHRRLNPARTVPVIDVEGEILIGYVAEELRSAVDRAAHRYALPAPPPVQGAGGESPAEPAPVDEGVPAEGASPEADEGEPADVDDGAPAERVPAEGPEGDAAPAA